MKPPLETLKTFKLENYQQFRSLLYALKLSTITCKAACDWTAALIDGAP